MTALEKLLSRRFTILSGAGLSIDPPSNLPSSTEIMREVLKSICGNENPPILKHLPGSNEEYILRFEMFLSVLRKYCDHKLQVLDTMRASTIPNSNHIICAELIRRGWHHITCNFDTLIEDALTPAIPTLVWNYDFHNWDGKAALGKIHGSFRDRHGKDSTRSLRGTLEAVGKGGEGFDFDQCRQQYLTTVLDSASLLVVGYSGTDDYDVNYFLVSHPCAHDIVWVNHCECLPIVHDDIQTADIPKQLRSLLEHIKKKRTGRITVIRGCTYAVIASLAQLQGIAVKPRGTGRQNLVSAQIKAWATKLILSKAKQRAFIKELFRRLPLQEVFATTYISFHKMKTKRTPVNPELREQLLRNLQNSAEFLTNKGLYTDAKQLFHKALTLSDNPSSSWALRGKLGNIAFDQGRYTESKNWYDQAMRDCEQIDNDTCKAQISYQQGRILHNQGYVSEAREIWETVAVVMEKTNRPDLQAIAYNMLGVASWQLEQVGLAEEYFTKSLELKHQTGNDSRQIAATLFVRSLLGIDNPLCRAAAFNDVEKAEVLYSEPKVGDLLGIAIARYMQARLFEADDQLARARECYEEALVRCKAELNVWKGMAVCRQGLARTTPQIKEARRHHQIARRLFDKLECKPEVIPQTERSLERLLEVFV